MKWNTKKHKKKLFIFVHTFNCQSFIALFLCSLLYAIRKKRFHYCHCLVIFGVVRIQDIWETQGPAKQTKNGFFNILKYSLSSLGPISIEKIFFSDSNYSLSALPLLVGYELSLFWRCNFNQFHCHENHFFLAIFPNRNILDNIRYAINC